MSFQVFLFWNEDSDNQLTQQKPMNFTQKICNKKHVSLEEMKPWSFPAQSFFIFRNLVNIWLGPNLDRRHWHWLDLEIGAPPFTSDSGERNISRFDQNQECEQLPVCWVTIFVFLKLPWNSPIKLGLAKYSLELPDYFDGVTSASSVRRRWGHQKQKPKQTFISQL